MGRKEKDTVFAGGLPPRGVDIIQRKLKNKMAALDENELDSYNKFVDKIGKGIKRGLNKKQLRKRSGASPGRIKAEFGTEMSRGGEVDVVDLTTEMVIDE